MQTPSPAPDRGHFPRVRLVRAVFVLTVLLAPAAAQAQNELDTFNPGANGTVRVITVQPDKKILVGGDFTTLGGGGTGSTPRHMIARVLRDGTVDAAFDPGADDEIYEIAPQADGKILIGGFFSTVGGGASGSVLRSRIARLNQDGSVDATFDPGVDGHVYRMVVQPDGKIVVGGSFGFIGGGGSGTILRNNIARLNPDGTVDSTFNPGADSFVTTLALQADGKILVGGGFTTLGGGGMGTIARSRIGRLNPDGSIDAAFDPGANGTVYAVATQPGNKIVVGGAFSMLGGGTGVTPRSAIGRLNVDGSVDAFDPGSDNSVFQMRVQPDGKILLAGAFTRLGGGGLGNTTRNRLGRITADGALDPTFFPLSNGSVFAMAFESDGKVLIGGAFTALGSGTVSASTRNFIGRMFTDPAIYDPVRRAPACGIVGAACDSALLEFGRASLAGGSEPNQPNTILDGCADGTGGVFHQSPSLDRLRIVTLDGGPFAPGRSVRVEATVWASGTGASDSLNLFFTATPSAPLPGPMWSHIGTVHPPEGGPQVLTTTFVLPSGPLQAIRGRYRFQGSVAPCDAGTVNDHDDLIFAVGPGLAGGVVDLNADTKGDVFIYSPSTGSWAIQNSAPAGGFTGSGGSWSAGFSVTAARFNDDSLTDFFLVNPTLGQWFVMVNNGSGSFDVMASGAWWPGWERFVGDLTGDGISDVFLWDAATGTWFRCLFNGSGFTYDQGFWSAGWEVYPSRFNLDAIQDFFLFNRTSGHWFQVFGDAVGGFTYPSNAFWSTEWALYFGDFNGDGFTDVLLHRADNGFWFVATSGLGGFSYTSGFFSVGWRILVMDLDANGRADLFMHNEASGQWFELLSDGAGAFPVGGSGFWSVGWKVYPGDLNGDGRGDLLLYNQATGAWFQARNLTLGTFEYSSGIWDAGLTIVTGPITR